jgi:hypothetical protein
MVQLFTVLLTAGMPEAARYRNKEAKSGIFLSRYRTEITDAGMPMPALVFWMPMPTYGKYDQSPTKLVNIEIRGSGFSAKSSNFLPPKWSTNAGYRFADKPFWDLSSVSQT